mmetsp:Transcript_30906/g.59602  ORF Transcript_30906/g.59602 Transcript_30906/m.59602 type:complete len:283 (-) Transcript_30906:465-1313(-)
MFLALFSYFFSFHFIKQQVDKTPESNEESDVELQNVRSDGNIAERDAPSSTISLGGLDEVFLGHPKALVLVIIATVVGCLVEFPGLTPVSAGPETGITHISLYSGYAIWGIVCLAQKKGLLPELSGTSFFALLNLLVGMGWSSHAEMKPKHSESHVHHLAASVAYLTATAAAGSLVSDKLPKLGRASSFVSLAAQMIHGTWLMSIGQMFYSWRKPADPTGYPVEHYQIVRAFYVNIYIVLTLMAATYIALKRYRKSKRVTYAAVSAGSETPTGIREEEKSNL